MNFGQNFYNWFTAQAQPIVIVLLVVVGLVLLWQRKLAEGIGFLAVAIIAIGLVWNPYGAKDALLEIFNTVVGGGSGGFVTGILPLLRSSFSLMM